VIKYRSQHIDEREKPSRWIDPRLHFVRPGNVWAYLLHKGWKPVPSDRPGVLVFEEPTVGEEGPRYQFVPNMDWEGYPAQCTNCSPPSPPARTVTPGKC
jgi:hypothetical protein